MSPTQREQGHPAACQRCRLRSPITHHIQWSSLVLTCLHTCWSRPHVKGPRASGEWDADTHCDDAAGGVRRGSALGTGGACWCTRELPCACTRCNTPPQACVTAVLHAAQDICAGLSIALLRPCSLGPCCVWSPQVFVSQVKAHTLGGQLRVTHGSKWQGQREVRTRYGSATMSGEVSFIGYDGRVYV